MIKSAEECYLKTVDYQEQKPSVNFKKKKKKIVFKLQVQMGSYYLAKNTFKSVPFYK